MAEKIEDFGRVIPGAAKHRAAAWLQRVREVSDEEYIRRPLSEVFPHPDYAGLIDDGHDPLKIGYVRALREAMPSRPRGRNARRQMVQWFVMITTIRDAVMKMIDDPAGGQDMVHKISGEISGSNRNSGVGDLMMHKARAYSVLGHEQSLKDWGLFHTTSLPHQYYFANKAATVICEKAATVDGALQIMISRIEGIRAEAGEGVEKASRKRAIPKFYSMTASSGNILLFAKFGRIEVPLEEFADQNAARKWLSLNREEAINRAHEARQETRLRGERNAPRIGPRHRDGDVSPEDFMDTFGFSGVQFGNYVEGVRRQEELNRAWDGLMDLGDAIGVDPTSLSLKGRLSIAFGARGKGGKGAASAHYEPGQVVINLTKNNGAGSFAHEFGHALDNLMARAVGGPDGSYLSSGLSGGAFTAGISAQLNQALLNHPVASRSANLDRYRADDYYSTSVEMFARMFESMVKHRLDKQGRNNDWLANILDKESYEGLNRMLGRTGDIYPYLHGEDEFARFTTAFDRVIGAACSIGLLEPRTQPVITAPDAQIARQRPASSGLGAGARQMDLFAPSDQPMIGEAARPRPKTPVKRTPRSAEAPEPATPVIMQLPLGDDEGWDNIVFG
ncbi:LPD5 domain-containing protein [Paracoccus litorisediminis]|uniref:LPD1 domain-containing protein n=1 Tax=Paracoccus litorisediminis TaxID=2006130 RepID=UPI00373185A3